MPCSFFRLAQQDFCHAQHGLWLAGKYFRLAAEYLKLAAEYLKLAAEYLKLAAEYFRLGLRNITNKVCKKAYRISFF